MGYCIETFDASTKQNFKLHASLLWTINEFPAYGNLSGWSTKGKLACPCCNKDTSSIRLANCKKQCFMGHRRYLPLNHKWMNDKKSFDGTEEKRLPPKKCSGIEILHQVHDLERAWPEDCIGEGYIANECMNLCSRYLHTIDTKFNRPERNYDGGLKKSDGRLSLFCQSGKTLGAPKQRDLEANELEQTHIYILKNCDEVIPFLEEFAQTHVDSTQHLSDDEWNIQFIVWFKEKVAQLHKEDDSWIMEDLLALSHGPTKYVLHYNGYIVNGYRLHAKDYDKNLKTQNCGVVVVGDTDKHSENIDYYGVLTDVLELQFTGRRVVLFECKWFDAYDKTKGVKIDEYDIVASRVKATTKYAYVASGAIEKGRGKCLRSMSNAQGLRTMNKNYSSDEKGHIPSFSSTDELMQYIKTNSSSMSIPSADQGWRTMNKKFLALRKSICKLMFQFLFLLMMLWSPPQHLKQHCEQYIKSFWLLRKSICKLMLHFLFLLMMLWNLPQHLKQVSLKD
ncbi:hypothetical protein RDI58_015493 [Solanum bulbocastanum]|uniref:DUF4218 domain-containing protein n=1 Tax=Solanum bulbocastanum TaxID=147425 RepID=A0AAN8TLN6_SOLBU